jgi:6-phosphogluconate dehydrogenase
MCTVNAYPVIGISSLLQRDYFGAHTFRVLPGKENARLKPGEDIRE